MSGVQIITAFAFWLFLVSSLAIIVHHGGRVGRQFVLVLITAVTMTFLSNAAFGSKAAQPLVLGIDIALLVFVVTLALYETNYWPTWFAGFHSISVASGLANLAFPTRVPELYVDASGFWALPALGSVVAGVLIDRRARVPVR